MKAIVFDVDNTLVDWKDEYIFALKNVLKEMNLNYSQELVEKIDNIIDDYEQENDILEKNVMLDYINSKCNLNLPLEFIDKLLVAQGECIYENKALVPLMEYLSNKYDLFVISNWYTKTQKIRLEKLGIAKYFKKIIGADINYLKPDKRAFDIILKDYAAKDIISIGDSFENDIELPASLGMKVLWRTTEKSDKYKTFEKIEELKDLL